MANLITATQVRAKCRPISKNFEDDRINMFIPEAEQLDIKPLLGEQMYITLLEDTGTTYSTLINGGTYTVDGRKYIMSGLLVAIAYFVYARLIINSDGQLTRLGFVQKDLNESDRPQLKEKLVASEGAKEAGNAYLNEVLQYIQLNKLDEVYTCADVPRRRFTINAIGD